MMEERKLERKLRRAWRVYATRGPLWRAGMFLITVGCVLLWVMAFPRLEYAISGGASGLLLQVSASLVIFGVLLLLLGEVFLPERIGDEDD